MHLVDQELRDRCLAMTLNFLAIDAACGDRPQEKPGEDGTFGAQYVTPNIGLVIPAPGAHPWAPIINHNFKVVDTLLDGLIKRGAIKPLK